MNPSDIQYKINTPLTLEQFTSIYDNSTLAERRPAYNPDTMQAMMENAQLTITAWDGDTLIGISRTLTDFEYVAYLSDLAVAETHQRLGIGKRLMQETQSALGEACMIILLAAPDANDYYPKIGFEHHPRAWVLPPGKPIE